MNLIPYTLGTDFKDNLKHSNLFMRKKYLYFKKSTRDCSTGITRREIC